MQSGMKDRVAVIVGATDGIGEAIARRLASQGAKLALCGNQPDRLTALAATFVTEGHHALAVRADPADPNVASICLEQIRSHYGAVHILVNNSPALTGLGLDGLTAAAFNNAISATLGAQLSFMHECVPLMRKQGYGRIVNLSSLDYLGLSGRADSAAALSGIFGLTRSVALEVAHAHVTVNTVVKGNLADPALSEEENAKLAATVPVKRTATTDDIAYAVGFFAGDESKYVTGQTLFVCGGKSAYFSMSV